jgi:uncharacterized protein (TIGR02145 family)
MKAVQMMMMRKVDKPHVYGYLYNWYAVEGSGNNSITSSDAWYVPSVTDLETLINYLILNDSDITGDVNNNNAANYLKSTRKIPLDHPRWTSELITVDDRYNFSALPGGVRDELFSGDFEYGTWWSSTVSMSEPTESMNFQIFYDNAKIYNYSYIRHIGSSIRIVREANIEELLLPNGSYCISYHGNDGKKYKAVKIGTLVWLAENLAETKYRNGDPIPNVTDATEWAALTTGARCAYNNDESYV